MSQQDILDALEEHGDMTCKELVEVTGLHNTTINRQAKRLRKWKLIKNVGGTNTHVYRKVD